MRIATLFLSAEPADELAAAKTMLISTDIPLGDIASACGFNSQSYFCDCFKRQLGMSPKIFRKNATYKP